MAYTFYHKLWECDFENLETNKVSANGLLEVTDEDLISADQYMKVDFQSHYFQDDGENHIFSPCEIGIGNYTGGNDLGYYFTQGPMVGNPPTDFYRVDMDDPKLAFFYSESGSNYQAFTSDAWVVSGWTPPDEDYEGWVQNLKDSYIAAGLGPESVNLYVIKIMRLKFNVGFSTDDRYIPLFYKGNDPAI